MIRPPLLHRGSVKDVLGLEGESSYYLFYYSDRYSVFDWGPMPDDIEGKGKALAFMADFFFRQMGKKGFLHHSLGLWEGQNQYLKVRPIRIVRPKLASQGYDYGVFKDCPLGTLVPLEVIFRFGVPQGSSLLSRFKEKNFKEGERFETPMLEFSTKLEEQDSYIEEGSAREKAALTRGEWERLTKLSSSLAFFVKDLLAKAKIDVWDGKFEFAFAPERRESDGERDFLVVDSLGPDELRLSCEGQSLSKENLRQFYRKTEWFQAVEEAKKMALQRQEHDWKALYFDVLRGPPPPPLDRSVKEACEKMYSSLAQTLLRIS